MGKSVKRLIKHGNSRALIIDKGILAAAGIADNAPFQISLNPNGGITIQSVDDSSREFLEEHFEKINKKYKNLMKRLAAQ